MPGLICDRCGTVHNPDHCQAHSKRQGGGQCERTPSIGMQVCSTHGGKTPKVIAARDQRIAVKNAETAAIVAYRPGPIVPVTDPLRALQMLAGETLQWKNAMSQHVQHLRHMRYQTDGGEAVRAEVELFERAMDRVGQLLIALAKLNIDERLVRIEEQRKDMILAAIEAGLNKGGIAGAVAVEVKAEIARRLRVAAAHHRVIEAA